MEEIHPVILDPNDPQYDPTRLLTSDEVATILNVTRNRVQQYARRFGTDPEGGLRCERVYDRYVFHVADVLAFKQYRERENDQSSSSRAPGRRYKLPAPSQAIEVASAL